MSSDFGHADAFALDGAMAEAEIRNTLVTLADRGETADEIAGAARAPARRAGSGSRVTSRSMPSAAADTTADHPH